MDPNADTVRSMSELLKKADDDLDSPDLDLLPTTTITGAELLEGHNLNNEQKRLKHQDSVTKRFRVTQPEDGLRGSLNSSTGLSISGISEDEAYEVRNTKPRGRCVKPRELKLKIFVILLFALIVVGLVLTFHFYNHQQHILEVGKRIYFDEETRELTVSNVAKDTVLFGKLGLGLNSHHLPFECTENGTHSSEMCVYWKDLANLTIHYYEQSQTNCYQVRWQSLSRSVMPWDCYDFGDAYWYGGGLFQDLKWPLRNASFQKTAYILGSTLRSDPFGPVLEPYWLTSNGVAIFVDDTSPLHVSFNATSEGSSDKDGRICFYADYTDSLYYSEENELPVMNYTICVDENIKEVHKVAIGKIAKQQLDCPRDAFFKFPLWSTWGYFKNNINQTTLETYTQTISQRLYGHSVLVIDDSWQSTIGDLTFNEERFPEVSKFIMKTKDLGFNVSVSVTPFVATDSDAFQDAVVNDYAVYDNGGSAPGMVWWWRGVDQRLKTLVAVLDMHGQSQNWFSKNLNKLLREHNIDSLRSGGGDNSWLPYRARFHDDSDVTTPNQFAHQYAQLISETSYFPLIETAYKCQHLAAIPRLYDADSTWSSPTGLRDVIPRYLTLGLLGYTYPVPDPAGGTGYSSVPDKDLFLRWLGMQTFFPVMHLSIPPYKFDAETEQLSKDFIRKHDNELLGMILDLAKESLYTRIPVVRPLWWIAPTDTAALTEDTEFMLGDRILVAPVLSEGDQRDIYLPKGTWKDKLKGGPLIEGPANILYTASLGQVPYFELQY